jgi:sulfate adenylyltransferase subunit 2
MILTHLQRLEAEAIHIFREAAAEAERPVMLYSAGKDSSVLLHLARKAFHPAPPPFPLLHVDTMWKFKAMYELRDKAAAEAGMELIVHRNPEAEARGINPLDHGSSLHTQMWKTDGLKQALDKHGFDVAFGGARRDEERVRAKERIFSFRSAGHRWDPKRQRPELWNIYNGRIRKGENVRVFPISNWTELDVWNYIQRENIALPNIYFTHERECVVLPSGQLLGLSEHITIEDTDEVVTRNVRFRTVGDSTCTAAVESDAATIDDIIQDILVAKVSERGATRLDDNLSETGMEDRKRNGYF